jgi:hypothetical protein
MSPRCHGNRKLKIEHVVTKAMAQSTFVPSLISIEAFFTVSCDRKLFNENGHFSQYAHKGKG